MEKQALGVLEEIRLAAEGIFAELYHDGDMTIEALHEKLSWKTPIFDWALGWLVSKEDIMITPRNGSFVLRRTAPAPAVFPLRSD